MHDHSDSLKYLVRPAAAGTKDPQLFLMMHGYGSNAADLFSFAKEMPDNFCVISAQAPYDTPYGGYAWFMLNPNNLTEIDENEKNHTKKLLNKLVTEVTDTYQLNKDFIWTLGFSQGGMMAYWFLLDQPQKVKRALMLSSAPNMNFINPFNPNADFKQSKAFISHGLEDTVLPYALGAEGDKLLKNLHIDTTFKSYNEGHNIGPQNYFDMMHWINVNQQN